MSTQVPRPPRRQHYVPRFLQKGHCGDDGQFYFTQNGRGAVSQTPRGTFWNAYHNSQTVDSGSKDHSKEAAISKREGTASRVVARILREVTTGTHSLTLTDREKRDLDSFVLTLALRQSHVEIERNAKTILVSMLAKHRLVPMSYIDRFRTGIPGYARNLRIEISDHVNESDLSILQRKQLTVLQSPHSVTEWRGFVLGKRPVMGLPIPGRGLSDDSPERQYFIPVSPSYALLYHGFEERNHNTVRLSAPLSAAECDRVNELMYLTSDGAIIGVSATLVDAVRSTSFNKLGRTRQRTASG